MNFLTNKSIFIVDDSLFWTELLAQMLTGLGYDNLIQLSNGTDCIKNLYLNPGLVFLDYQMDDIDGLEVLQEIKNYFPGIAVVFCTATEDLSIAISAIQKGSQYYLLKENVTMRELDSLIKTIFESDEYINRIN